VCVCTSRKLIRAVHDAGDGVDSGEGRASGDWRKELNETGRHALGRNNEGADRLRIICQCSRRFLITFLITSGKPRLFNIKQEIPQ